MVVARPEGRQPGAASPVSWKSVAVPTEHGGWGMLGEPLVLGLLLAPTWAGAGIVVAGLAAFFARHPLKLALADRRRGSRHARTALAARLAAAYALVAVAGLALAFGLEGARPLAPLMAAAPLALVQLAYDSRLQGRRLLPEIVGGVALTSLASSIMLAGGWGTGASLAVAGLLAGKTSASILYVRARLRLDRGLRPDRRPVLLAHAALTAVASVLGAAGWAPWLAALAALGLTARAAHGLSRYRRLVKPKVLGFQELGCGIAFALMLAAGFTFGW